jgi:hypothetical protein
VGQNFYDCNPVPTFTSGVAMEACAAYAASIGGSASNCSADWDGCPGISGDSVCYAPGNTCGSGDCFGYSEESAGNVAGCDTCTTSLGSWQ